MSYSQFPNYYEGGGGNSVAVFTEPSSTYTYEPTFFDPSRPTPAPKQGGFGGFIEGLGKFAETITPIAQGVADVVNAYKGNYYNQPSPFGRRMAGEDLGGFMGGNRTAAGTRPGAEAVNMNNEIAIRLPAKMAEAFGAEILQNPSKNFFTDLPPEVLAGLTPKVYTEYIPRSPVALPRIGDPVR